MINEGEKAPDFEMQDSTGKKIRLKDFAGKTVALYFYPKDFTSGCTTEACNLRDNFSELKKKGIVVLGVSADNAESHARFRKTHELPFELLADENNVVSKKYGVYGEKNIFGKIGFGIKRTTFLIGPNGVVKKVFTKVDTANHSKQIMTAL